MKSESHIELPTVGITLGDPNGIGPEVTAKALSNPEVAKLAQFILFASEELFLRSLPNRSTWQGMSHLVFADIPLPPNCNLTPGPHTRAGGIISSRSLEEALNRARAGSIQAIVTAPVSKKALNLAGCHFAGQTEFVAAAFGVSVPVMMLIANDFRVALATTHCALTEVVHNLTADSITTKLKLVARDLRLRFKIPQPKIAVCALNPHAGEGGLFGDEERNIIVPAVERAVASGLNVTGPFPADTLFARATKRHYDAYFAMYHDQGLIPLKMVGFGRAVNYTVGVPVIRTSPDHGTAYDIAGKWLADSSSMEEAIKLAVRLAKA